MQQTSREDDGYDADTDQYSICKYQEKEQWHASYTVC